ncbi:MAG: hypothetical protein HOJ35_05915 [Bdellovibrionales bacterium]|jgi:5-(carboxyamino)imidazole ribonucleotide mutase|nr:hypothetical protein [Bdellovibrionales bacterium]
MKILVLFGSESDHSVFTPLIENLNGEIDFDIISAHRSPEKLDIKLKETKANLIIAGAGLAAHLPGVIASKTDIPVIGLPVSAALGGVDALFSILQMPSGVPVLTSSPDDFTEIINFINNIYDSKSVARNSLNLVIKKSSLNYEYILTIIKKAKLICEEYNFKIQISEKNNPNMLNIVLRESTEEITSNNELTINIPVLNAQKKNDPFVTMDIYKLVSSGGLWVGINNISNAIKMASKLDSLKRKLK